MCLLYVLMFFNTAETPHACMGDDGLASPINILISLKLLLSLFFLFFFSSFLLLGLGLGYELVWVGPMLVCVNRCAGVGGSNAGLC